MGARLGFGALRRARWFWLAVILIGVAPVVVGVVIVIGINPTMEWTTTESGWIGVGVGLALIVAAAVSAVYSWMERR